MSERHPAQLLFSEQHPLTAEFDMQFHSMENHVLEVTLKAPETFADRDGLFLHTGFNTLILDTVMGACALGELKTPVPIATIKLSSNHLRKIPVGEQVTCRATWDGEENSISYVRGEIRCGADQVITSQAVAAFMVGTTSKPLGQA